MQIETVKSTLSAARAIRSDSEEAACPPSEVKAPATQPVLPHQLFRGTRGYLEKIVFQVNGSYSNSYYDACAVMIRRLLEVLIIEVYEHHKLAADIRDQNGDYFFLQKLIPCTLSQSEWRLSRTTRKALPKLKEVGDLSAHGRRYNAKRQYIDELVQAVRVVAEELLYLGNLK